MNKNTQSIKRQKRIRKKITKVSDKPRLTVFRSNKYIYAQIIDDKAGKTIISATEKKVITEKVSRMERAKELGNTIAKLAKEKNVSQVVFDKGRYTFHGRVKALAEGAREGGLQF